MAEFKRLHLVLNSDSASGWDSAATHRDVVSDRFFNCNDLTVTRNDHFKSGIRWLLGAMGLGVLYAILFFGFRYSVTYVLIFFALPFLVALGCAFVSFRRASRLK